ncbi:conserved hypothetical protein [Exiguobacterium sp. 8H]|uniref:hypothetical protein n=1 Tax=unclassified Exiguobacterium TaxID=2644629 RepID=UPI0012F2E070|nr:MULTISPECIES: hypothetical protein [unclassified Exiguobacterium]VXB51650.1 conserved hypothetical protein [Exiguobacterium sp. 8A]VXB52372.1 conserved hypothetical protein [Exiguobacterium sp. 8H]
MRALLDALADYLDTELTLYAPVKVGNLDSSTDAICIRQAPSPDGPRYLSGRRLRYINFQLLAKSEDQQQVLDAMELMSEALELSNGDIVVPDFEFIKCEVTTETNWVEETSTNQHIYTALFQCQLIRKG